MTEQELADLATSLGYILQGQKGEYRILEAEFRSIVGYKEDAPGGWGLTLGDVEAFLTR
ncbi:MAG: hypothetical protein AAGC90_10400 [Curtobacterium sp.]